MSQSKHTPVDKLVRKINECKRCSSLAFPASITREHAPELLEHGVHVNERMVPWNLVDAAPELLDLLKMALSRLDNCAFSSFWESREEYDAEIQIYKDAIAKAEGRE